MVPPRYVAFQFIASSERRVEALRSRGVVRLAGLGPGGQLSHEQIESVRTLVDEQRGLGTPSS